MTWGTCQGHVYPVSDCLDLRWQKLDLEQNLSMATSSPRRRCLNNLNVFCYICGEYTLQFNRKGVTEFAKCAYLGYFKIMLSDQDKAWASNIVCKQCVEHLRKDRKSLRFGILMVRVNQKTISMTATSVQSTRRESTGRTGIS